MGYRPFTKTEMKILVYNKVKLGMDYNSAVKQLDEEIKTMKKIKDIELATTTGKKTTTHGLSQKQMISS